MDSRVEFDVHLPVSDRQLLANVRHALSLGLPELRDFEYPWNGALNVIASGPSARKAPLDGKTLALNGAMRVFTQAHRAPTYWAACDPQELVADFLTEAPESTIYLVASRCHPSVFERLKGRNVVLWHLCENATYALTADRAPVSSACSITLCAFEVMARLGWRGFETWGWDGCYVDGESHAVAQPTAGDVTVQNGEKTFRTTTNWLNEAKDASLALNGFPFPIHVHGGGMIGEILKSCRPWRFVTDVA